MRMLMQGAVPGWIILVDRGWSPHIMMMNSPISTRIHRDANNLNTWLKCIDRFSLPNKVSRLIIHGLQLSVLSQHPHQRRNVQLGNNTYNFESFLINIFFGGLSASAIIHSLHRTFSLANVLVFLHQCEDTFRTCVIAHNGTKLKLSIDILNSIDWNNRTSVLGQCWPTLAGYQSSTKRCPDKTCDYILQILSLSVSVPCW